MDNLAQFFSYMNDVNFSYVVLRNWENLPHAIESEGHSDLDLLVYDLEHFLELFPMVKMEYPLPRVRAKLPVGDRNIYMDLRYVGDGYYPTEFEQQMLDTREAHPKGFFTPNPTYFRIALAYHVVHHKGMNTYPRHLGTSSVNDLFQALKESAVGWVEPKDPTVGRYNQYFRGATSVVEINGGEVTKKQTGYKKYNLLENEARILERCDSVHFPKVIRKEQDIITLEFCGEPLTLDNLPVNWKKQMIEIHNDLKRFNVQHRDIRPDNITVKDGILKLIDFGWARFYDDPKDTPPSCLGYPFRPSWGWDDEYSIKQVVKLIDYKVEERSECESVRH